MCIERKIIAVHLKYCVGSPGMWGHSSRAMLQTEDVVSIFAAGRGILQNEIEAPGIWLYRRKVPLKTRRLNVASCKIARSSGRNSDR